MAAGIFGDALDMDAMRFRFGKWWTLQPARVTMSPDGNIWMHPNSGIWREDYSTEPLWLRAHIMHELTHVWQHQQGVNLPLRRHPFCRYGYRFDPGKPFAAYGLEQQAELVKHAYVAQQLAHSPPRTMPAKLAPPASFADLADLLPFEPDVALRQA